MHPINITFLVALFFINSLCPCFADLKEPSAPSPTVEFRLEKLTAKQGETERFHDLCDVYWDWRMREYPDEASFLGYPGEHGQWPDFSQDAMDRRQSFNKRLLDLLVSIEPSSFNESDHVSYRILKRMLEEDEANRQFGSHYLMVNQMHGIHLFVPMVIEFMPRQTENDYENILSRLRLIPPLFKQIIILLDEGLRLGVTPPRLTLVHVPQQILNQIIENPLDSPLLKAFQEFPPSMEQATTLRLLSEAESVYREEVIPSFLELYSYINEKYLPGSRETIAFSDLPQGEHWYAHLVRSITTTELTPQEIHAIGLKEVERIHEKMQSVIKSADFEGTFEEFLHFMKSDSRFFYPNKEELLSGYQALTREIASKLPVLFTTLPSLPVEVIPIPSYSEASQIAAYYCGGSITDQRPGYFYINTSTPEKRPKWEMKPLSLHEAVPGHHLQIALAQELQGLPEFRKHANFTAYIEGWGLYAESLGSELGLYQDPYSIFGRLTYEMLRAIRLVIDTGMHAMGWSRDQAIAFFKQYVGMGDHEIETEVDRYLVMPAQALAYKIGELHIQRLRQWAAEQLGDEFDLRAFHNAWLEQGTVPLDVGREHIEHWVRQSQQTLGTVNNPSL